MTRPPKKALSDTYKVGYGRPPTETRFRKERRKFDDDPREEGFVG
jgi:hypothetical protein